MSKTINLTSSVPSQSNNLPIGGAWTAGTQATIWKTANGWAYCLHGVEQGGNYFETDDVDGFATEEDAEAAAREHFEAGEL